MVTNETTYERAEVVIKIWPSNLKSLIIKRNEAIDAMRDAKKVGDTHWVYLKVHHCRRLSFLRIRIALHRAFNDDHDRVHNRITELGKLI